MTTQITRHYRSPAETRNRRPATTRRPSSPSRWSRSAT